MKLARFPLRSAVPSASLRRGSGDVPSNLTAPEGNLCGAWRKGASAQGFDGGDVRGGEFELERGEIEP